MKTKERLLQVFEKNKGVYFSGEALASLLSVSRTAVWKGVCALREGGYPIDAVPNRGYCLSPETDILSAQGIEKYLLHPELKLEVVDVTTSTNALLRQKAGEGAPEGTVVLSGCQTAGRGRLGRSFYSPADTGIYMSLLLRPRAMAPSQAVKLTTMAAAAACRAIAEVSGKDPGIKWVNDIFLEGKKVCGILTEASLSLEDGSLDAVVLGAGINVYPPAEGFPGELGVIAGAVFDTPQRDGKNRLAAAFLNRFFACYRGAESWMDTYREKNLVVGREITVSGQRAAAVAIDQDCRLVVRFPDGAEKALSSGEIQVKL